MTGAALLIAFIIMIIVMVLAISKFKIHPFLSMMGVSLVLALLAGLPLRDIAATDATPARLGIPAVLGAGFSGTFSNLGIVIILGALIGFFLEKTGAALKMADVVVRTVGKKRPQLAMLIMGWIVSIPVFCDSGYVILNPIRKAMTRKTGTSGITMAIALSLGLYTSHVLIPPTPGPIAAANSLGLGDNMLLVIGVGVLVSIPVLIAAYFFAQYIGKRVKNDEDTAQDTAKGYDELIAEFGKLPGGFESFLPIVLPIVLMAFSSVVSMAKWTGGFADFFIFLGTPMIALACGLLVSIYSLISAGKAKEFLSLTEETLKTVGPILFVTAAGGVLGRVITEAGIVSYIRENFTFLSSVGIFFPFLLAAILKTAQGSSTVAITTTAAIMGLYSSADGMMASLGLTSPLAAALTVMAIGVGAMTVSHANDSYFWVVTNFGAMKVEDGYKTQTLGTLVTGIVGIVAVWVFSLILL